MLKVFLSTDRGLNQEHLLQSVSLCAGENGPYQFILVPEQISHMLERKLCAFGGDSISQFAEILGFSRLAVRVFSEYGGLAETETDGAGKLLTMSLTVEQLRSQLKLYGSKALKPNFLLQLSRTLDELRSSCIDSEVLREKCSALEGAFAVKMEELALLLDGYDSICANLGQNPDSHLTRLLLALEQNDFARGKRFLFYGFTDFNGIELEIIRQLMASGGEVYVYLLCDQLRSEKSQFATSSETALAIVKMAQKAKVPYELETLKTEIVNRPVELLREYLFSSRKASFDDENSLRFMTASDIATECRMVAGEVLRLLEKGIRLRDITIACGDYETYRAPLRTTFHRAEIPAYFAGDTDILKQPVVHMLLSAMEAAISMDQEAILNYMKAGFSGLTFQQADKLENYILLWNIDGMRFTEAWTMSTQGFMGEREDLKIARLSELNESRLLLITPLLHLSSGMNTAKNTGEMLLALNDFMEEISLNEKLNERAVALSEMNEKQKAQEYAQVYGIICTLMEQMYGVLGETIRSAEDFCQLFRTAVSLYTVGTIPATIDCVNIGSIASQRNCDTPYLFIIGANEGAFPGIQTNLSLLSDRERQQLIDLEIGISPNTITSGLLYRELAMIDSVLGGHAQTLYLSAIDGKQSYFYLRGEKLFPNAMHIERDEALTLRSKRDYEAKYSYVDPYKIPDLSPKAVDKLYGKVLSLSASKLETGASCRFGYFLQYGLRAKESLIAEVDASIYGTFVHDILENTCKQVKKEGGFHRVSLERVLEIADGYMERFAMEELSELWHSDRAEYLFRRNFREVRSVVKQLYEELSVSLFEPEYFELNFSDREGADIGAISIQGQEVRGKLEGKVDRVDLWKSMGRTYYRVVDYKTGRTSFDYTKVYYGLGLQMLLYLFALKKYGNDLEHENLTPAGVLYFPARKGKISVKNRNDVDALRKEREKQERRSGILLSNESVLQAMEPGECHRFLPCKKKKDGELAGDLASTEDLQLLEKHVFRQISGIADGIHSGKLEPNPYYMDSNYFGCAWCPFTSVCKGQGEKRVFEKVNAEEFWERLREEEQNG